MSVEARKQRTLLVQYETDLNSPLNQTWVTVALTYALRESDLPFPPYLFLLTFLTFRLDILVVLFHLLLLNA